MKRFMLALFCLLPFAALAADAPKPEAVAAKPEAEVKKPPKPLVHYVLVTEQSKLKFVAIENSAPVEGAFSKFSADIHFSPDDLEHSFITAEVDISSVFAAYPEVAKELVKADWLDADKYAKATLRTKLPVKAYPPRENDDRGYYYADADLTIRGKTMPVTINFMLQHLDDESAVAEGRFSLMRRDFGVGQGKWQSTEEVDDVVAVTFRAVAKRVNP